MTKPGHWVRSLRHGRTDDGREVLIERSGVWKIELLQTSDANQ